MEKQLMSFLNTGRDIARHDELDRGQTLGASTVPAQKGNAIDPPAFGRFATTGIFP